MPEIGRRLTDPVYRAHDPRWSWTPASGAGAARHGGRFNRRGAPALYIGTEAARAIDLKPAEDDYWTAVDSLDIEGGARLTNLRGRIEDPFQLVGMNALGLPGVAVVVLGMKTRDELRQNLEWLKGYKPLGKDELAALEGPTKALAKKWGNVYGAVS